MQIVKELYETSGPAIKMMDVPIDSLDAGQIH